MSILKNEICKLFTKRTLLILLIFAVLNPLLQFYHARTPGEDLYTPAEYSALYREVSAVDAADITAVLKEKRNKADNYREERLCRRVSEETAVILAYADYLASVDEKTAEIEIMQRFLNDGGYSLKSAKKISEVYRRLEGITPTVQDPMPLLNITDNDFTDYLAVIMIFIIALTLVFYEKNEDQLSLLRTTAKGRRKLMAAKIAAMFLAVTAVVAVLFATNALMGRCLFGSMELGSPIQSIYRYRTGPFRITVGGYLALYFPAKILTCFLLGVFFMLMCAVFNNIIFVFVGSAVAVLTESLLYAKISGTDFLSFLKYLNVSYGLRTGGMFSDYVNLNLFGNPVSTLLLYWILWAAVTAVAVFAVAGYLEKTHETKASPTGKRNLLRGIERHTSVFLHECYKLLIPGRCLIVLALAIAFTVWWNPPATVSFDSLREVYYKDYMDRFYGPLNAANRERINAEQERYDRLFAEIAAAAAENDPEFLTDMQYAEEQDRSDAFADVMTHVEYLETVEGSALFFDKGYRILTDSGNYWNRDTMQAFVYIILLVAMAFGIFGLDHRYQETRILRSTYRGRGTLARVKCILGASCTLIAFSLVYLVHTGNVLRAYGTGGIHAPAACMEHLSQIPGNLSVLQYILLVLLLRLLGGVLIVVVIFALFRRLKNGIFVMISCVGLFLIPLVLVALNIPGAQYFLLNPLLLGNVF